MVTAEVTTHECAGISHQAMVGGGRQLQGDAVAVCNATTHVSGAAAACGCCCGIDGRQLSSGEADLGFRKGHEWGVTAEGLL